MQGRPDSVEILNLKLLVAISEKKYDDIRYLITLGADLAALHNGKTPIEYACELKLWNCVHVIAKAKKTDPNDSYHYANVMVEAAQQELTNCVEVLIDAGAPVNGKKPGEDSLLHWAVRNNYTNVIKMLIAAGADMAAIGRDGYTPMDVAVNKPNYINPNNYTNYLEFNSTKWDVIELLPSLKPPVIPDVYHYGNALLVATTNNRTNTVKSLLKAGVKPDCTYTGNKSTPLHEAVIQRSVENIKILLEHGADPAAENNHKQTPMQLAVFSHLWDVIEGLAVNAKTNVEDKFKFNDALIAAAKCTPPRKKTIEMLLNAGTPATGDIGGETLLHRAIREDDDKLILRLIQNHADLAATNTNKQTPMDYAVALGKFKYAQLLAKNKKNDENDTYHYGAALVVAVKNNDRNSVDALLDNGAMNNAKNNAQLKRIAHDAIQHASIAVLKHLLQHGADLSAVDGNNQTPIQHAVNDDYWDRVNVIATTKSTNDNDTYRYGSALEAAVYKDKYDIAKSLLEAGAKATWTRDKDSVLHTAIKKHNLKMLNLLLEYNVVLDAENNNQETPIELAVRLGYWDCVNAIIQAKKANAKDTYHYGKVALTCLQNNHARDHIQALIAAGACNNKQYANELLASAVNLRKLEIAGDVLAAGADINAASSLNGMPLHIAVRNNDLAMLRFLLEKGANQAVLNQDKRTPVELAAELGHWDCLQLLLEFDHNNGNDKQLLADQHYEQALLIAIQRSNYAAVKMLLEHHAPFDRCNLELGNIALYWAVKNNEKNPEIVTLLLEHGIDASVKNKDGKTMVDLAKDWRHTACFQRLNNYRSMIKPGKTADEYRQLADKLSQKMSLNSYQPEKLPAKIKKLKACHQALLKCDLEVLKQRRDALIARKNEKSAEPAAATLIDLPSTIDDELDSINLTIMAVNTLLNFSVKVPSPTLMRKATALEGKDVKDVVRRKSQADEYLLRVRQYLQKLDHDLKTIDWRIKGPFGYWVRGIPTHVRPLRAEVSKLPKANTPEDVYQILMDVMKIFASIDPQSKRHENTEYFYASQTREIKDLSFIPVSNMQSSAPQAVKLPVTTNTTYPELIGNEVAYPVRPSQVLILQQLAAPVPVVSSQTVASGLELIDFSVAVKPNAEPVPTVAPPAYESIQTGDDDTALMEQFTDAPARKVASLISVFSQPQTAPREAHQEAPKVQKEKRTLLHG